jgi:hypothetical protein
MIHIIMVAFNNPEQTVTRWRRDVLPGVLHTGLPYGVTVVDNSEKHSPLLADTFGEDYLWQEGKNLYYGGAINLAVPRLPSDLVIYACTNHGYMIDKSWVSDILAPLQNDPQVGAAGFLMGSNSPGGVAHDCKAPWIKDKFYFTHPDGTGHVPPHIQGGVFAARTDLMLKFPYPPDVMHSYTDHILTWEMLRAGYKCVSVPSILSLWRRCAEPHELKGVKYLHDQSINCTRVE